MRFRHLCRHGRLTECFESAGGNAAAATFIVIDSTLRSQGLGRHLMKMLEEEAKRLGYHYTYLWTKTAIPFYQKVGYQECKRVSLKRACLTSLDATQVESLEAILSRKSQQQQHGGKKKQRETILLPPTNDDEDDHTQDVWLRKRLVEQVGSIRVPLSEHIDDIKRTIMVHPLRENLDWRYFLLPLPWQAQIGPSCGLAALRMVRGYYFYDQSIDDKVNNDVDGQVPLSSLLPEAQERGYTQDGEVFNANNLFDLASEVCGLSCEMCSTQDLDLRRIWDVLRGDGVFILPYDSNARTRLPARFSGKSAHYGIIVGFLVGRNCDKNTNSKTPALTPLEREDDTAMDYVEVDSFYLMVQHSLSPKLSIARWSEFAESNQQLTTIDQEKYGTGDLDLKDRIIILRGMHPNAF